MTEYLTELTRDEPKEHMRPNFFANTPDINPVFLQTGGRPAHQIRAVLAATLSPVWGMYNGFELCEATPIPGKEDYLDSEKYEIKAWDWDRPGNIRDYIAALNRIRRENPALWRFANLEFHNAWNDNILVYSKMTEGRDNAVLVAVNLDPASARRAAISRCRSGCSIWATMRPSRSRIFWPATASPGRARCSMSGSIPHQNPAAIWRLSPPGRPA